MEDDFLGLRLPRIHFDNDGGGGGGGDPTDPQDGDDPPSNDGDPPANDGDPPRRSFDEFRQEFSSTTEFARELYRRNQELISDRARATRARQEVQGELEEYRELGTVDDLREAQKQASEADELRQFKIEKEREERIEAAADVVDFNARILNDQLPSDHDVEVRTNDDDEKEAVVVMGEDEEMELSEYAEQHLEDYLPVLKRNERQQQGTQYVTQGGGGSDEGANESIAKQTLSRRYRRRDRD